MAKQGKKDAAGTARRKLADAQAKLQSAQERRSRVVIAGEQDVERARAKAAARLDRATKEVEQRAAKVARAEAKLISLQSRKSAPRVESSTLLEPPRPDVRATASPADAAERLEDLQIETIEETDTELIVLPNGLGDEIPAPEENRLDRYESALLNALGNGFQQDGATFTEWLSTSRLSKRTFLRARRTLVDGGLVRRNGDGQGARYFLTDEGKSLLDSAE